MNQKVVNIALALAVIVLLVLNFSNKKTSTTLGKSGTSDSSNVLKIAYVDLDSLQANYVFYQEQMLEFEKKKEVADRNLNNAYQQIDGERITFLKKGQAITQAEGENFQRAYQGKMQNLEEQKKVLENNIATEGMKIMEDLKKRMNTYLEVYNKTQKYSYILSYSNSINVLFYKDSAYNITNEVVGGLNEAYKKTKLSK